MSDWRESPLNMKETMTGAEHKANDPDLVKSWILEENPSLY